MVFISSHVVKKMYISFVAITHVFTSFDDISHTQSSIYRPSIWGLENRCK